MGETEGEWSIYGFFPGLLRGSSNVLKVTAAMHHSIMVLESMGWHTTTCLSMEALHRVFRVKSCSDHGHDQLYDLKNISRLTLGFLKYKMGEHTDCVEAWAHLWHRVREAQRAQQFMPTLSPGSCCHEHTWRLTRSFLKSHAGLVIWYCYGVLYHGVIVKGSEFLWLKFSF